MDTTKQRLGRQLVIADFQIIIYECPDVHQELIEQGPLRQK
jgi:hypothetical protein